MDDKYKLTACYKAQKKLGPTAPLPNQAYVKPALKEVVPVLGIDLGTTNSAVAVVFEERFGSTIVKNSKG